MQEDLPVLLFLERVGALFLKIQVSLGKDALDTDLTCFSLCHFLSFFVQQEKF